jgi:murein DD-endopeptidase MepM/ murein hydrolase activator NlpD
VLNKRLYTFIVASNADAKIRRLSVSYSVLTAAGIAAIIAVLAIGLAAYHYTRMALRVADHDRVLAENDAFRSENHNYRIQTAQLGEKLDFLETMAQRLAYVAGMESDRSVGGVGGYSKDNLGQAITASGGTLQAIDRYNKNAGDLENGYRDLESSLALQSLVKSVTPSLWPVRGYLTAAQGWRPDPFNRAKRDYHTGVDISAPFGTRVIAPADGIVLFSGYRAGYGNIIVLDHKFGVITRYGHLSKSSVQSGQRVSRHDGIGFVGNTGRTTGPHLHFELWMHNKPVNPQKFLAGARRG